MKCQLTLCSCPWHCVLTLSYKDPQLNPISFGNDFVQTYSSSSRTRQLQGKLALSISSRIEREVLHICYISTHFDTNAPKQQTFSEPAYWTDSDPEPHQPLCEYEAQMRQKSSELRCSTESCATFFKRQTISRGLQVENKYYQFASIQPIFSQFLKNTCKPNDVRILQHLICARRTSTRCWRLASFEIFVYILNDERIFKQYTDWIAKKSLRIR